MLKGTIKFNYIDVNGAPFTEVYDVIGIDTSATCMLKLSTSSYRAIEVMAGDDNDDNALWSRRMNVGINSASVERKVFTDASGKVTEKLEYNYDFFLSLAALIRYSKVQCKQSNAIDYTGFQDASGEYIPETCQEFNIPDADGNIIGTVTLEYGEIRAISVKNMWFTIDLSTDPTEFVPVFEKITNSPAKAFKLDREYLGFNPVGLFNEADLVGLTGMYRDMAEVIAAHPEKEFAWLLEKNYVIVDDTMLDDLIEKFMMVPDDEFIYCDTETTGLNINFKSRIGQADQCVGIILSVDDGESFYFPMQMKSIPNLCGGDHWFFMSRIKGILESKKLVGHNSPFDWKVCYIYDINANFVEDTMAMLALTIGAEKENYPLGLKDNTSILLKRDSLELSDLVKNNEWGESDIKFWDLPAELVRYYACADTDNTRGIFKYVMDNDLLQKYNATRVYRIEVLFGLAVAYQEFYGHRVDVNDLEALKSDIDADLKSNMDKMVEIVGYEFNPNSPKQLVKIMYEELGIPEQRDRKTGRLSTSKEVLGYLAGLTDINDKPKYPFVSYLKKYREAEGVRKIISQFNDLATNDGFLFSHVMQYGTTTGRVSINTPNYQSYNDAVKKYIRPRDGYYMADTDYSSVEYRVTGNMSGNEMIKQGFYDPDFDYHTYQAARMYGVPYATVTPELRKTAKGFNFGIPYGMGNESLGVRIFGEASEENTRKAAELHKKYFAGGQEDVEFFFENARDKAVANGYTETYFGRRRYYYRNKFSIPAIRRQAGNAIIQGCLGGDTRIQTREMGIVKIKDAAGYTLDVWDGKKWTNGDVMYSGKKQKCIVHFAGGMSMVCSPIHKFLVRSHRGSERFVECKDLICSKDSANPHRVVINENYTPSDYCYSSESFYKFKTDNSNSKNLFLEDISQGFDIGVFLGRLASDGSYQTREDGGSYLTHIVAEHESNILPELRKCMESYGFVERDIKRHGRNEKMTYLSVYSSSLVNEINELDIKHKVHDNIFMDTEVLRGFLSGFFDGDGGISGRTITLVFGVQYDFEPMCLDLQKALLFFGIRSRYRKYDDRYVIQIKTYDNERFLDLIGFLNQDKQDAGRALECVRDEHVFGKCLVVESVEITDEYIDMYDVCNTDDGYFVADGVVTHNTAADIYKLAVGRVFLRVCKEGWLGKVLFPGFIHDELLLEIHNSIDPMVFLKALREEFEVKIEGWCPLYMGFGFGMSWYQAKKTELPIQLQWELVDRYGEKGYPNWHGDGYELCNDIDDILRDFSVRHVAKSMLLPEAQGLEIKPALNSSLVSVLKEDAALYSEVSYKFLEERGIPTKEGDTKLSLEQLEDMNNVQEMLNANKDDFVSALNKVYISTYATDASGRICLDYFKANGIVLKSKKDTIETQLAIDVFCKMHNTDRTAINLLNIDTAVKVESATSSESAEENSSSYSEDDIGSDGYAIDRRVDTLGMYLDTENSMVILKLVPTNYMNYIKERTNTEGKGYRIRFKDVENKKLYDTTAYLSSEEVQAVQQMYIMYFKAVMQCKEN